MLVARRNMGPIWVPLGVLFHTEYTSRLRCGDQKTPIAAVVDLSKRFVTACIGVFQHLTIPPH